MSEKRRKEKREEVRGKQKRSAVLHRHLPAALGPRDNNHLLLGVGEECLEIGITGSFDVLLDSRRFHMGGHSFGHSGCKLAL